MMNPYLQVALGGAMGSVLRFAAYRVLGTGGFPVATMAVNVLGSLAMGMLAAILLRPGGPGYAPFLMTGILGGFTTFSAFSLDTLSLWERGQTGAAVAYVAGSVVLSLVAVVAGMALGRGLVA